MGGGTTNGHDESRLTCRAYCHSPPQRRDVMLNKYVCAGQSLPNEPSHNPVPSETVATVDSDADHPFEAKSSVQKSSALNIPSRTSSTQNAETATSGNEGTDLTNASPEDQSRTGSKRAILSRSRNNSRSSKRSLRAAARNVQANKEPVSPFPQQDGTRSEKKAKSGGFLSFLNCCGSDLNDSDESNLPAVKPKVQPAARLPQMSTEKPVTTEKQPETLPDTTLDEKSELRSTDEEPKPTSIEAMGRQMSRPGMTRESASEDRSGMGAVAGVAAIGTAGAIVASELPDERRTNAEPDTLPLPSQQVSKPAGEASLPNQPEADRRRNEEEGYPQDVEMPDASHDSTMTQPTASSVDPEPKYESPPQSESIITQVPQGGLPPPPPIPILNQQQIANRHDKQNWLLPSVPPQLQGRKCLVLDLDETLVHSSFKILNQADFTIPVEIEGQFHNVYVIKRPGVDQFMKRVGELYEVVVFTASVSKYGDPLLDQLDIHKVVHHRLFRESCYNHQGNYVKVSLIPCEVDLVLISNRIFLRSGET